METATLVADGVASWISVMVEIIDFTPIHTHTHRYSHPTLIDCTGKQLLSTNIFSLPHLFFLQSFSGFHGHPWFTGASG